MAQRPRIICVCNQKGGIGKTTTAVNLAASLGRKNKKVLLIDTDNQANASEAMMADSADYTISDVFEGVPIENTIYPSVEKNVDIIPSETSFNTTIVKYIGKQGSERILKDALESFNSIDKYNYIIIDTPPALGLVSINALATADEMLIPVHEFYGLSGVKQLIQMSRQVKSKINPHLEIGHAVLTKFDTRTNLAKNVQAKTKEIFGDKLLDTIITYNIKLAEAPIDNKSIFSYDPECAGAKAYEKLAEELLNKWSDEL